VTLELGVGAAQTDRHGIPFNDVIGFTHDGSDRR
jgi:hypothetical protein